MKKSVPVSTPGAPAPAPGASSASLATAVPQPDSEGRYHGVPRRSVLEPTSDYLQPHPNVRTLYDILKHGAETFKPSHKLFGTRELLRMVEEEKMVTKVVGGVETTEKKVWKYFELSGYSWITYKDAFATAAQIGAGLRKLGLGVQDKVTLFASTSRDWMLVAQGCYSQNMLITTAYDTLGEEGLSYSLNEGEVTTLFTQADLLPMVKKIGGLVPTLKNIIYNGKASEEAVNAVKAAHPHLNLITLEDLRTLGAKNPVAPVPPSPEDLCCIMYTSGSTGTPKGVMLKHRNIVAAVASAERIYGKVFDGNDYYLAYLPLAHVLEFTVENFAMFHGFSIGYGSPRTLSDSSVRNCKGDIRELSPTLLCGVPAVWETIRKGVMSKVNELKPSKRAVFDFAFNLKWSLINMGLSGKFIDNLVFKAVQQQTGGRIKMALSGGAPMPAETQKFMTVCVCTIVQGYGMTETCGTLAIQTPEDVGATGVVGAPFPCGPIKLVSVPDTAYTPYPTEPGVNPRGEIWATGGAIMAGYFKQPQATAEALTADGWLMTGDIGEWLPDGSLAIIDRKKNLVKLSNGEYIAIEKLEAQYKTSPLVTNICVYADPLEAYAVGLILPVEKEIRAIAVELGLAKADGPEVDYAELCANPEVNARVYAGIKANGVASGFKGAEILGAITLIADEWTPQNDMLTAAQKLKRADINKRYMPQIKTMYGKKA
ncbi:hypothetical protein BC831DRAFT_403765 [Entophlyctis helioformis]|nr:hypothetical protein BC831DRAFT_403765 [Entophlyctis helioformis]